MGTPDNRHSSVDILSEALSGAPIVGDPHSTTLPVRILFTEQLSALIGKSPTTIRTFATSSKYKHLIPRPFKMPGSRRLCWYENDVLEWIEATRPAEPPPERRPRGRPTKREQQILAQWASGQQPSSVAR